MIQQADIVYITHCWRHGLRVNDPSALLRGRVLFLLIRTIVTDIVTLKERRHDVVIYFVFWWGHSWEFYCVSRWDHSWEFH